MNKMQTALGMRALQQIADEDRSGFRPLTGHRDESAHRPVERLGLIYRSPTCEPLRCSRRSSHGSVPSGDCLREGWSLSLRGRLVIELLNKWWPFDAAVQWATENES